MIMIASLPSHERPMKVGRSLYEVASWSALKLVELLRSLPISVQAD